MVNERQKATLDTNAIASIAGVSRRTVQRWRSDGKLAEEPYRSPSGWPYYTTEQAVVVVRNILPHLTPTEAKARVTAFLAGAKATTKPAESQPIAAPEVQEGE